jgi:hypothetical protein
MKLTMKLTTLPCLMVKILKNFIGISRIFKWSWPTLEILIVIGDGWKVSLSKQSCPS